MSTQIAETLLAGTRGVRGSEPPARSTERRGVFEAAFDRALAGGAGTEPARRGDGGDDATAEADASDDEHDEDDVVAAEVEASSTVEEPAADEDADQSKDAVEISADAAAAAAVVAPAESAPAPEVATDESPSDGVGPLDETGATPEPRDSEAESEASRTGVNQERLREFHDLLPQAPEATANGSEPATSPDGGGGAGDDDAIGLTVPSATGEDGELPGGSNETADGDAEGRLEHRTESRSAEPRSDAGDRDSTDGELELAADGASPGSLRANEAAADARARTAPDAASQRIESLETAVGAISDAGSGERTTREGARPSADQAIHAALANGVDQVGDADRARFVGRVEGAIRAAHARDGRIQVRLSPPELGALRIELNMHQGVMSARLEAETPAARNLLLDNLPALRERLAQQDVRVDRFDVDVRRDGGGTPQQDTPDRPQADGDGRRHAERREALARAPQTARPTASGRGSASSAALDVRV